MNTSKIILFVIIILIVFFAGVGVGILQYNFFGGQNAKMLSAVKVLSSQMVPTISAYGQVAEINGKIITISFSEETLSVPIRDDAKISSVGGFNQVPGSVVSVASQPSVDFNSIKKGDNVTINMRLLSDGTLEGTAVFILPSAQ
jgi:hypothetical protein